MRAQTLSAELDPIVFDPASGRMVITYQTFVVRTPRHTVLIDTCTGEDKGYPAPYDFPKQPWLDSFHAAGLRLDDITHVFCTHLHFDQCGWNTMLRDGRWTPTFPNAKYIFHKDEYAHWEAVAARDCPRGCCGACRETHGPTIAVRSSRPDRRCWSTMRLQLDDTFTLIPTPGHSPRHCCVNIRSQGPERDRDRRPDASRAPMPRAELVDDF